MAIKITEDKGKGFLYLGLAVALAYLIYQISGYVSSRKSQKAKEEAEKAKRERERKETQENLLNQIRAGINPENLSYSENYYQTLATAIFDEFAGITEDEEAIIDLISKARNIDDLEKIIVTYGFKKISNVKGRDKPLNLMESIKIFFSDSDIKRLNKILSKKSILWKF